MAINPIVDSRDVRFILFEMLEADKLTKYEKYSSFDKDMFEDVLNLAETIAVEQVYPINAAADKKHAQYNPTPRVSFPRISPASGLLRSRLSRPDQQPGSGDGHPGHRTGCDIISQRQASPSAVQY